MKKCLNPHKSLQYSVLSGAGDGTRTRNLLITNQLLYQLSYAGKMHREFDNGLRLYLFSLVPPRGLEPRTN